MKIQQLNLALFKGLSSRLRKPGVLIYVLLDKCFLLTGVHCKCGWGLDKNLTSVTEKNGL